MNTKKVSEMTELEMHAAKVPDIRNMDELAGYITQLIDKKHDYGTCVYAMSMAAVAAYNLVAHKLGVTGFQASMADMDILRRTRGMEDGFKIVNGENLLYPQYDVVGEVETWIEKMRPRTAESARKKLAESGTAHPDVRAHWERLAAHEGAGEKP